MKKLTLFLVAFSASTAFAEMSVPIHLVNDKGVGANIGQVTVSESKHGLVFTPTLKNLSPGLHGFHIHQNPSCEPKEVDGKIAAAGAAGDHYDPESTKRHSTPWGGGHLGDLPPLFVEANGTSTQAVLAPRLKLNDLRGRTIMVHTGGDNHADHPAPLGGGAARVACGVVN